MSTPAKPRALFGRDEEWAALTAFVENAEEGPLLGLVSGRRRQGKTFLLQALVSAFGGFYWQARQQTPAQNLHDLAGALTIALDPVAPFRFVSWEEALGVLLRFGASSRPVPVVIDEVGYVIDGDDAFPSRLQAALAPFPQDDRARTRLLLCGSALGQMRRLLDPQAPLRGRASLDLVVQPFDYRTAAAFWGVSGSVDVAFQLDALIGGTPAHRLLAAGDRPIDGDLDGWVCRRLLTPSSPLFHEGRLLIAQDAALGDTALYWGLLAAVAEGARTRGTIATALGRPPTSLHRALTVLVDAGWLVVDADPLRDRRSQYRLGEPIVRTQRIVIEPNEARLGAGRPVGAVWDDAKARVATHVYGPHLEHLARTWLLRNASEDTTDGPVFAVGATTVGGMQVDVVALGPGARGKDRVTVVGEAKATSRAVGLAELERLDRVAAAIGPDALPKRLLVARSGFTAELRRVARRRDDVELVDLRRLYSGS